MNTRTLTKRPTVQLPTLPRLLLLALFFLAGVLLGQVLSGRVPDTTGDELRRYLEDYVRLGGEGAPTVQTALSALVIYFRYPLFAFLLGFASIGVVLLPCVTAAYGFFLSFSVCCFTAAFGVDGVLLAGDLYDKPVPPAEAVRLLDWFLTQLAARRLPVFAISGNHDSADRIAFGSALLESSKVYVSPVFSGAPQPIPLQDAHGTVDVYLLPFLKPAMVRHVWPDEPMESYNDALACVLRHCELDPAHRSVLVAHQFVAGAACCESEEVSVGGVDSVDASLFDGFDYVALGHLHSPQKVGRDAVRYCGTPLKYSFSEAVQHKSATFVELGTKGEVTITTAPLTPKHDLREVRGSYMELTDRRNYAGTAVEDYLHITLTDEQDVPDALARLRVVYPNLMRLDYDNLRTREDREVTAPERTENITPLEHFAAFYELQNNQPLTDEQAAFCQQLIEDIWKEGEDA